MKNRNPYLSCIILWIGAICVSLGYCIYGIVSGNLFLAISQLLFIVFDSIYLGWCICKFNAHREFVNYIKEMEERMKKIDEFCCKEEPFKEFEDNAKS